MTDPNTTAVNLNRGARIKAHPCVVTITLAVGATAYGNCESCGVEHIIDRRMFEAGGGPWRLASGSEART